MTDRFKRWLADRLFRIASWCHDRAESLMWNGESAEPSPMGERMRSYVEGKMLTMIKPLSVPTRPFDTLPSSKTDSVTFRRPPVFEEKP